MPLWIGLLRSRRFYQSATALTRASCSQRSWHANPCPLRYYSSTFRASQQDDNHLPDVASETFNSDRLLNGDQIRRAVFSRNDVATTSTKHAPFSGEKQYPSRLSRLGEDHASTQSTDQTNGPNTPPGSSYVNLLDVWEAVGKRWNRYVRQNCINERQHSVQQWLQFDRFPVLDIRAAKWSEEALERLAEPDNHEALEAYAHALEPRVWLEVMLWLLTFQPESVVDLMLVTYSAHNRRLMEHILWILVQYFHHSRMPNHTKQWHQVRNAYSMLTDRAGDTPLGFGPRFYSLLTQNCSPAEVRKLYQSVKDHNAAVDWRNYLGFATKFARNSYFELAYESLREARFAGAKLNSYEFRSTCSTILRKAMLEPDGLRVCLDIVSELAASGVKLDAPIYDIIILNAVEAGDPKTAFAVYHSLKDRGLEPKESTFSALLKSCRANIDDAESLHEVIRDAVQNVNVRGSAVLATQILHCLALHHMKHRPDTALKTVTEAYSQFFDLRPLERLGLPVFDISQRHDEYMLPAEQDLNLMMNVSIQGHIGKTAHASGVFALYERLRTHIEAGDPAIAKLAADPYTPTIFLQAFIQHPKSLMYAARLIRDMQQTLSPSAGVEQSKPTVQHWTIFMHGFTKNGKPALAEKILVHMRNLGLKPDNVTWNTLMTGYAKVQDAMGTVDAIRRAERADFEWDGWTWGGLGHLRDQDAVLEELNEDKPRESLDFSDELKEKMSRRVEEVGASLDQSAALAEPDRGLDHEAAGNATADGSPDPFVDLPSDVAETSYRPFRS